MLLLTQQHWSFWDTCKNQAVTRELLTCKSLKGWEISLRGLWEEHTWDALEKQTPVASGTRITINLMA